MASAQPGGRAERTRASILEAAETCFAEGGFAATRLEDVAARVGIRRASIVYHFRDKAELYDAVLADVIGDLLERVTPVLTGPGSLVDRSTAAVSTWIDYVAARPTAARLMLREVADGSRERLPALVRHTRPFYELIERVQRDEPDDPVARGSGADPVQLATTVAGSTVFFFAAMPTLLPGTPYDPHDPDRLEAHRAEMIAITRRALLDGTETC